MEILTAQNIFLDENTGGKGRHFTSRFLQPGLVKYSFGVCLLAKETIDKFIYQFVGCPVIINHKDVTNESAKEDRMGVVSRVWFDQMDGWYWCEGIIFEEQAISLIEDGYNVSCQYEITEYSNNTTKALHNGNPYDKVILNGKPEHLAIVKTPRYESAMIAINALDLTAENEDKWITIKPNGEDGKGRHLLLKDGETPKKAIDRVYKKGEKSEFKKSDKSDSKENNGYYKKTDYEIMPSGNVRKIEYNEGYDAWGNGDARHTFLTKEEYEKETGKKYEDLKSDKSDKSDTKDKQSDSKGNNGKITINKPNSNKRVNIRKDGDIYRAFYVQDLGELNQNKEQVLDSKDFKTESGARKWANKMLEIDTAKNNIIQAINELKENKMFNKLFKKKEHKMEKDELKELFMDCIQDVLKAQNEEDEELKDTELEDEEKEEKKEKAENKKKACNEDKRKLIDEVAGMLKSAGCDNEIIRTAIAKMEKIGYDKSEADTADNGKKAKCEDEDEKEEVLNKAKNSIEALKGLISQVDVKRPASKYITKAEAIELGNKLF